LVAAAALSQSDQAAFRVSLVPRPEARETRASLFDFASSGAPVPPEDILSYLDPELYPPSDHTLAFVLQTESSARAPDANMVIDFHAQGENTTVSATAESSVLASEVERIRSSRLRMPLRLAEYDVDWRNITTTTRGASFEPSRITRMTLARFDDTDLEASFLTWETPTSCSAPPCACPCYRDGEGQPFATP